MAQDPKDPKPALLLLDLPDHAGGLVEEYVVLQPGVMEVKSTLSLGTRSLAVTQVGWKGGVR